jgi:hypothetical protein
MARDFLAGSSQYFINTAAVVPSGPLTMACWFNPDDVTTSYILMSLSTNGGVARHQITSAGAVASDPLQATTSNSVGTNTSAQVNGVVAATWQHAAGVFNASAASTNYTSRLAYLNGTSATESTALVCAPNRTLLGARISTTVGAFLSGLLAEAAIWNAALPAAEIASLAAGYCPLFIRPQNLVAYWPLFARATNEEDWVGGFTMTNTNTVTAAQHPPRLIYPRRRHLILPSGAAPTAALRRNAMLNGLSTSGPFFANPLG